MLHTKMWILHVFGTKWMSDHNHSTQGAQHHHLKMSYVKCTTIPLDCHVRTRWQWAEECWCEDVWTWTHRAGWRMSRRRAWGRSSAWRTGGCPHPSGGSWSVNWDMEDMEGCEELGISWSVLKAGVRNSEFGVRTVHRTEQSKNQHKYQIKPVCYHHGEN